MKPEERYFDILELKNKHGTDSVGIIDFFPGCAGRIPCDRGRGSLCPAQCQITVTEPRHRFITQRGFMYGITVILSDYQYWVEHEAELDQWCEENGARRQGMTVEMDDEILTVFLLRWS